MSFISANDHPNPDDPQDPLYYAPRSERSIANPRSHATPQTRSDHLPPAPPLSRFDEMREEAFAKFARPLEAQFVYERRRPRGPLAAAEISLQSSTGWSRERSAGRARASAARSCSRAST